MMEESTLNETEGNPRDTRLAAAPEALSLGAQPEVEAAVSVGWSGIFVHGRTCRTSTS